MAVSSAHGGTMSQQLINQYLSEIDKLRKFSGLANEQVIRPAFRKLLDTWASSNKLVFMEEFPYQTSMKTTVYPDGTVLHDIRVPLGYWEAKDTKDDLNEEIRKKFAKGYPQDNIIFENSEVAVLVQNRQEVMRAAMTDTAQLLKLVSLFFGYERAEIAEFRRAVEQFKADLPSVLSALRTRIETAYDENTGFRAAAARFLDTCKETINPTLTEADVREMLIQHILTEEIFTHVFNESDFHRENNIAKELYALESKFFTGSIKRETLKGLETYYAAIRANAAQITNHSEKQTFLKVIYENFYKVYDTKKADRLGVVYTPNEIVKFMIEGADWLCEKHFSRNLIDDHVEILDPATGTGTFICEILEYFRGDPKKLAHKFKNELHANEVAILPYYVANLNIEATYAAISGQFAEFPNLCFVDTLDNVAGLGIRTGQHVGDLFGGLSDENIARVQRQNKRKISVIIGNPPYNANQANENDNNKNRDYPHIDQHIKDSYIRLSRAHKTKLYDMYARFFRWASDRMHDDGVLAFITNRSFIDSRTFDGFRKAVAEEFNEIYVVDLGGDVRANPKLSGTKHNVFGIQTGVAISFFVKRHKQKGCKIFYARRPEFDTATDKLSFLGSSSLAALKMERLEPDENASWISIGNDDFHGFLPMIKSKLTSNAKVSDRNSLFHLNSYGAISLRDGWVYDFNRSNLEEKLKYYIDVFNETQRSVTRPLDPNWERDIDYRIKWSQDARRKLERGDLLEFQENFITIASYRPFSSRWFYYNSEMNWSLYQLPSIFPLGGSNVAISFSDVGRRAEFMALGVDAPADIHFGASIDAYQQVPLYRYTTDGERIDNITDWGLRQFHKAYGKDGQAGGASLVAEKATTITKLDIFHYVYGVLHDPLYREKYAENLKREFPRIPLYPDFWAWAAWGKRLMELHIGYETVDPWPLARTDTVDERARAAGVAPKTILKADTDKGVIRIDSETTLSSIPKAAFDYRLGNRSGLEWILDQYKEKAPKDPTVREKFNTYRFADYKKKVIDLIARVTRVSFETMEIVEAMKSAKRTARQADSLHEEFAT